MIARRKRSEHEAQIGGVVGPAGGGAEVRQIGQDTGQLAVGHAEPARQRGGVLVHRGAGQQAALADVPLVLGRSGVAHADRRRRAVEGRPFHRTAHHQMVAAPAVVGAIAVGRQRAAEVRRGERRDLVGHAQRGVQVEAADRHQEHLAPGAQSAARRDQPGDHLELVGQRVAGGEAAERRIGGGVGRQGRRHLRLGRHGAGGDPVVLVLQQMGAALLHQRGHRCLHGRRTVDVAFHAVDRHRCCGTDRCRLAVAEQHTTEPTGHPDHEDFYRKHDHPLRGPLSDRCATPPRPPDSLVPQSAAARARRNSAARPTPPAARAPVARRLAQPAGTQSLVLDGWRYGQ